MVFGTKYWEKKKKRKERLRELDLTMARLHVILTGAVSRVDRAEARL